MGSNQRGTRAADAFLILVSLTTEDNLNSRIFIVNDRYLKKCQISWIGNKKKLSFSLPQKNASLPEALWQQY